MEKIVRIGTNDNRREGVDLERNVNPGNKRDLERKLERKVNPENKRETVCGQD